MDTETEADEEEETAPIAQLTLYRSIHAIIQSDLLDDEEKTEICGHLTSSFPVE